MSDVFSHFLLLSPWGATQKQNPKDQTFSLIEQQLCKQVIEGLRDYDKIRTTETCRKPHFCNTKQKYSIKLEAQKNVLTAEQLEMCWLLVIHVIN